MSNFVTNLLLIKDKNITMEDKLDLINIDGQDTFVFHGLYHTIQSVVQTVVVRKKKII